MKAVQFEEHGGPEVVQILEVEEPHAGPGQVRIKVRAAAVNPADYKTRAGVRKVDLPSGLGFEASGVVDEVGEGVSDVTVGDPVFGKGPNTFAEYALLHAWARKPEAMSFEEAAATGSAAETAIRILDLVGVKRGQTLLVSGAAGGVGTAVVQLARRRGITVIGTATEGKHGYLRSIGAIPTTYGPGLVERVRALAPEGVDAAFDLIGSGVIPELVELTGDPKKVLTILLSQADKGTLSTYEEQENPGQAMAEAAKAFEEGAFRMRLDRTFPFDQVGEATRVVSEGRTMGKLVVLVS